MSKNAAQRHESSVQLRRVFRTSATHLFQCFTDPTLLASWWGPEGTMCINAESDARVGGKYRIDIQGQDSGEVNVVRGEYLVVEAPRRLVYSWAWDATPSEVTQVQLNFEAVGEQACELHLVHERFPDLDRSEAHARGWRSSFVCLQEVVSRV